MLEVLRRTRAAAERSFRDKEIHLRVDGRVTFFRLSSRLQKGVALTAATILIAALVATAFMVRQNSVIAEKDMALEEQKLAYFELLSEVNDYQAQFSQIVANLEQNQDLLLSMVGEGDGEAHLATIEDRLARTEGQHARVVVARDALRTRLRDFESNLVDIAERSETLETQVTDMKQLLEMTEEERRAVAEARAALLRQLRAVETQLARSEAEKAGLEESLGEVSEDLNESEAARTALIAKKRNLEGHIDEVESQLAATQEREGRLQSIIATLNKTLAKSRASYREVAAERDALSEEVLSLEGQMAAMETSQERLVSRLMRRTRAGIETIESTVARTGLPVDDMLSRMGQNVVGAGGPFVPWGPGDSASRGDFEGAVTLLDLYMSRWEGLRQLVGALPLSAPLDSYSVTSSFGVRTDPITNERGQHAGLDMGAPHRSPILAPAPGKVVFAGWKGAYGRLVEVDHGFGIRTRYGHLRKIEVEVGDELGFRDRIGQVGSSGRSTGPHLHYEIRLDEETLNPAKFLEAGKHVFKG